ncbi:hypothetical protein ACQP1P_38260 [Dactylosporangium sp. CA-052675]|uniref:hypothetical protein n=1 Tax=Dactylosporangium sp. CA-052675 TaxID=3239927 RepID=UPI003D908E91
MSRCDAPILSLAALTLVTGSVAACDDPAADAKTLVYQVPGASRFETLAGTAMAELFADAAAGRPVTTESIRAKLRSAEGKI